MRDPRFSFASALLTVKREDASNAETIMGQADPREPNAIQMRVPYDNVDIVQGCGAR